MDIRLVRLYDTYAPLLSERQREIMELYYNEDESLAEIAENTGITRQGVRDWIKKTENQLESFECALGLAEKTECLRACIEKCAEALRHGDTELAESALRKMDSILF